MNKLPVLSINQLKRFLTIINIGEPEDCWPFTGSTAYKYGHYQIQHLGKKTTYKAHRLVYRNMVGPFDESLHILHTCDNSVCCNPKHLYPGTLSQNAKDMVTRGRATTLIKPGEHRCGRTIGSKNGQREPRKRYKPYVRVLSP